MRQAQFLIIVTQDLTSPTIEEQVDQAIDDETILIVPSPHGFIQASDVIDAESVLPLTTLTGTVKNFSMYLKVTIFNFNFIFIDPTMQMYYFVFFTLSVYF